MNSKDLRNISEAYQSIQEQPRSARRRKPSKSVEQIKAEIDAKNPTKTGAVTGQKIPGVQQSRRATRIPNATGGAVTGSLRSGNLSFPGDRSGAYAAAKQSLSAPPAATLSRGARLLKSLKGPAAVAAEIGGEMLLEPVARKAGDELGKALTRGVASATGTTDKVRTRLPSYYGAKGPDLTRDIAKGIQQRSKLAQQSAETQAASQPKPEPTGERSAAANAEKQEVAKAEAQRRREAAAPKPAPKPPTAQERAYGARSKLTAAQQELNRQYDIDRGLEGGRVTKPYSKALDKYLAKRKK